MTKTGAAPSLLFTLATFVSGTFVSGSLAAADAPGPKTAAPGAAAAKPAAPGMAAPRPAAPGMAAAKPAPAPAAPSMPTRSKELEAFMKGFEGSWKCETKFATPPASPASPTSPAAPEIKAKSSVKIRKDFEGFSWHGEFKVDKTDAMPAMSGVFQIAYDPGTKQATLVSYDSMGASMMGAGPISGESVTFVEQGYMLGIKAKVREAMTKKSPKEIHHKVEIDQGKGFQLLAEDTCKK